MQKNLAASYIFLALVIMYGFGCAHAPRKDDDALYYRLGARKELGKIVTDTVDTWAADQRIIGDAAIKEKMAKTDLNALKRNLFSFMCSATDGPCVFGNEMLRPLSDLKISHLEWFYMLEGIVAAMAKHNVPVKEQNEVLAIVYSLESKVAD